MGNKKARRACAVRALRTSSDNSGYTDGEFWAGGCDFIYLFIDLKVKYALQKVFIWLKPELWQKSAYLGWNGPK